MAPTLIYYHLHDSSSNMDSPWIIPGLLLGGLCVYLPMALASALAKWSILSIFKYRPKILRVCGVALAELFIFCGLTLLPQWPDTDMKWLFSMATFAFCAMFPNLLLLPAANPSANWQRPVYAFVLGCVSALCVALSLRVLALAFNWLVPI